MPNVLIIVPVHNEEKHLPDLLPTLKEEAGKLGADIIAINDSSTDASLSILESHGINTLNQICHMGYGVTIQTGYKYAVQNHYNFAIQVDGDGQHDPRFVKDILQELELNGTDIVIGSRFLPKDKIPFPPNAELYFGTFLRRVGITIFRAILLVFCFRKITDPTSGYIGVNQKALRFLSGKSFPFDYPDADMVLTFLKNGFHLKEIPVYMYKKQKAQSLHRGCKPIWYVIKVSISCVIAYLRRKEITHG